MVIGLVAHVDSGKTTLSEAILFKQGVIRNLGRVDKKTAFLDNNKVERERGITVFAKEARFRVGEKNFTVLDTPGHKDFITETEKTMPVMDYALLIVSGPDGIKADDQTKVLWDLLKRYNVPTFIFVNKMDRMGRTKEGILKELREELEGNFIEFEGKKLANLDDLAMTNELFMDMVLSGKEKNEDGFSLIDLVKESIKRREIFPVFFGSALKLTGIDELLEGLENLTLDQDYSDKLELKVFKITRDQRGQREVHVKVTGGEINVKDIVNGEKVEQIRLYSGKNFDSVKTAEAGQIAAITGTNNLFLGQIIREGEDPEEVLNYITPNRTYGLNIISKNIDAKLGFKKLEPLREENPSLNISYDDLTDQIRISPMGELEIEVLKDIILERFSMEVQFGDVARVEEELEFEEIAEEDLRPDLNSRDTYQSAGKKELEEIFLRTYGKSKRDEQLRKELSIKRSNAKVRGIAESLPKEPNKAKKKGPYVIVDGYNVIFAWEEMKELAEYNIDSAREALLDILNNYTCYKNFGMVVVFDGYKVKGGIGSKLDYGENLKAVYTKEAETADRFIEETVYELGKEYDITVVTSDMQVQMLSMGDGAKRISAREFHDMVIAANDEIRAKLKAQPRSINRPFEGKL